MTNILDGVSEDLFGKPFEKLSYAERADLTRRCNIWSYEMFELDYSELSETQKKQCAVNLRTLHEIETKLKHELRMRERERVADLFRIFQYKGDHYSWPWMVEAIVSGMEAADFEAQIDSFNKKMASERNTEHNNNNVERERVADLFRIFQYKGGGYPWLWLAEAIESGMEAADFEAQVDSFNEKGPSERKAEIDSFNKKRASERNTEHNNNNVERERERERIADLFKIFWDKADRYSWPWMVEAIVSGMEAPDFEAQIDSFNKKMASELNTKHNNNNEN